MTDNAGINQVILDGERLQVAGPAISFSDLARFQSKLLFGDPSKDDNDLLSSWQASDDSGGSGVFDLKEGTDQQRFYFSTMNLRFPGQGTKPYFFINNSAGSVEGSGNKHVLGEMWSDTINDYLVIYTAGSQVRRGLVDGTSGFNDFTTTGVDEVCNTLVNGVPVGPGVSFQGTHTEERFYIPQGNNGYAYLIDTGTTLTEDTAYKFVSFAVWDNKLIGITTGGRLYKTVDGTTWTAYDLTYALSKSYRIRKLINYFDRGDRPCLYIITDRDIWQFDPDGPELFRIDFGWPSHKWHGSAACVWNGQLYIAVGMGVFRYSGGAWMPVGLDRDDGLPAEYQGHIVELVGGYNELFALVQGDPPGDSVLGSKSSLHSFSGNGWQCVWTDDTAVPASIQNHATAGTTAYTVTGLCITQSGGVSTLVMSTAGTDDHVYCCPLSITFANPRAGIGRGQLFGSGLYYYLETGEFDADMMGYTKIANAVQVYLEEPIAISNPSQRDTFKILYRVDRGDWELLSSFLAVPGRYSYPMGDIITGTSFTEGLAFEKIQFRYEIHRAGSYNADHPMVLTNRVMSFLKTVSSNDALNFAVDVSQGNGTKSPQELADFVDDLTQTKRFVLLTIGTQDYRVFVSQNTGTRGTGDSQLNTRQLSVVEIPSGL